MFISTQLALLLEYCIMEDEVQEERDLLFTRAGIYDKKLTQMLSHQLLGQFIQALRKKQCVFEMSTVHDRRQSVDTN